VVTISITRQAFEVIKTVLRRRKNPQHRPDGIGGYLVTLPNNALNKLNRERGPGESYSDVILRLAAPT
jgi:hypothetical protein